jgi:2Fe-2S ferredoxin
MPKLVVTTRNGVSHTLDATPGLTVMEVIRNAGIDDLLAMCGGLCSCATCHVYVDPEFAVLLPKMGADEDALLEGVAYRHADSRLSCQIRMNDLVSGLRIAIPPNE